MLPRPPIAASFFWNVIVPGASPFIIAGLRQSFLRSWLTVIGVEMLAASNWGLGWVIFDATQLLNPASDSATTRRLSGRAMKSAQR